MHNFFVHQVLSGNLILALVVALIAGLISFFSPCVLPLVPGYLAYSAGMTDVKNKGRTALGAILFVSGFSVLFISYGALFGSLGAKISSGSRWLQIILGLLTMLMGTIFLFNQKFYRSFKPRWKSTAGSLWVGMDSVHWSNPWCGSGALFPKFKCATWGDPQRGLLLWDRCSFYWCWSIF